MPKNKVSDLITDQEMAFAHLVLSGNMTDRQAAEAAGLNPESAAYNKAKPRVRAYMAEHRAALHEKLVAEESEGLRKLNIGRDQVLAHLWYLATLPPEVTRGNINGQLKATAMFASFGGLIPQASAAHPEQPSVNAHIYHPPWFWEQKAKEASQQSNPAVAQQEEEPALPSAEPAPAAAPDARNSGLDTGQNSVLNSVQDSILDRGPQTRSASGPVSDPPRPPGTRIPTFAELASSRFTSFVPDTSSGPDLRVPFSIDKTRFGNPNRFRNRR
jgi:hypothetical protein